MKARKLKPEDIRAHGRYPSDYGGQHTIFQWSAMFHLGRDFQKRLREQVEKSDEFCCFGAENNPLVLASCFNEVLKEVGESGA